MIAKILILDSITKLPDPLLDAVVYCASHGGIYSGALACQSPLRAVILSDAGVGCEQAGIASLALLQAAGKPAATVGHRTARIGDGADGYARGVITHVNDAAAALGVHPGDSCKHALDTFARLASPVPDLSFAAHAKEHRMLETLPGGREVVLVDSNSLVTAEDAGRIVVCGSHGGLLGGDPASAVRVDVGAIVFNDADRGIDDAGLSRLPALERRGIAAACVSAWSARIGDGRSSYETGVISALNPTARARGAELGMTTKEFILRLSAAA